MSYKVGEKVQYLIQYGLIMRRRASLELKRDSFKGKEFCIQNLLHKPQGWLKLLYKVIDIYESFIDPDTELPVKSIRNIS